MSFGGIEFANPYLLGLLILVPLMAWWYYKKQDEYVADVRLSSTQGIAAAQNWKVKARPVLQGLQLLAITALIIALARPQVVLKKENVNAEGIDIMLALDVSVSMLAKDFEPDRLEASKKVAADFVEQRKHDRIGLVVLQERVLLNVP